MSVTDDVLQQAIALHKQEKYDEAEKLYQALLNRAPFEESLLYLLADLYLRQDCNGMAINLLSNLLQNNPKHADAWCNLGAALRKEGEFERAKQAWQKALEVGGETVPLCNNMSTLYADHAQPQLALEWIDRALKIDPDDTKAIWQKSLALLTLGRWEDGWKGYEHRQQLETWDSRPRVIAPIWDGKPVDRLYIHGEQGIGDEVMFGSIIPKMKHLAKHITLEVHRKVAPIMRRTFPDFWVASMPMDGEYDAKIPIGSLAGMFGFNPEPYLKPYPDTVDWYRDRLKKLGPGPYVAVTWIGGTKQTNVLARTLRLKELGPILKDFTCVSGQYFDGNPYVEPEREDVGLAKINDESTGLDLHEQAALFKACDAVLTVQQTAVHVAGAVGAKTIAMISDCPPWRYGIETDSMPWYKSVKLIRKKTSWDEVISQAHKELHAHFAGIQRAEPATA